MAGVAERTRRGDVFAYNEEIASDLCRVALAKDYKASLIGSHREIERTLWLRHKRDARTKEREIELKPGKFVQMTLEMAEAFFGCFSIPILDKVNRSENEHGRKMLAERFALTRNHAIVKWGDYPRLARAGQGMTYEPLGPARFPDVVVTIIPGQEPEDPHDVRFKPVRLRMLYDLGEYEDCEHLVSPNVARRIERDEDVLTKTDFAEAIGNRDVLAAMQRQIEQLTSIINGSPDLKAKLEGVPAPTGAKE